MPKLRRFLLVAVSALTMVFTSLVAVTTPASATHASSCSGSLLTSQPVKTDSGAVIAYANVYYSSTNGGTNCMKVVLNGNHSGETHFMQALIHECNVKVGCWTYNQAYNKDIDSGYFSYYAGPVHISNTDGNCIRLYAYVTGHGHAEAIYTTGGTGVFCG